MKNAIKIIIILVIVGAAGGFVYWQNNKKSIIKNSIDKALTKKTDSLYFLQYDSSVIDEINGNVAFYNVMLQSDSVQKQLLKKTDSLPSTLFNIRVGKVAASGIDVAGLLKQQNVAAKKILLSKPVISIINTGEETAKPYTRGDTLELYQKILGKFNSIKADTIQVSNGSVFITNKAGVPQTTLENINITLYKFLIDSTKDYESIISYFVKDVRATVDNIQLPSSDKKLRINLEKIDYDAAGRTLNVGSLRQYKEKDMDPIINLANIRVTELNTDAFILQQRLIAGAISCDGGLVTIYQSNKPGKSKTTEKAIELSSDLIDQIQFSSIKLGKTNLVILNQAQPNAKPFTLKNLKFAVLKPLQITEGTTLNNLVNNAQWELSADGFSLDSKNGVYRMSLGNFNINNLNGTAVINHFSMKPLLSEAAFVKKSGVSKDLFNFKFGNIRLSGLNIKRLLGSSELEVDNVRFQPDIKIFNDKTLPGEGISKVGKYPHQSIVKLDVGLFIKTVTLEKGKLSYRERGLKSGKIGNVFFTDLNATVSNVTNLPSKIKADPIMRVSASAKFLGLGKLSSKWELPLNTTNGAFHIEGGLGELNGKDLNQLIEPLGMASIKKGIIDKVSFSMNGSNTKADGEVHFLYHDLKINLLKQTDEDTLKKKGLVSLLANTLIKNKNTDPGNRKSVTYERDVYRSFFNLVWKTIYTGVKGTAIGKK
ncbi:MAG: hypothetical protein V4725_15775 [Bacteroidota bacterium]